jgi:hypothetical protein
MCNIHQLSKLVIPTFVQEGMETHELCAVRIAVRLDELVDVTVIHPFRYHRKPLLPRIHTKEWENVWVLEVLPGSGLSA